MRAPGNLAHGVVVAVEDSERALARGADVDGTNQAVDARRGDDGWTVFIPVVRERFGWRTGLGVQRDGQGEVVGG